MTDSSIGEKFTPMVFSGMYSYSPDGGNIIDCILKNKLIVSQKGALKDLERNYKSLRQQKRDERYFLEAEGFISYQENQTKNQFDTLLVITKFVRLDTNVNCMR